MSGPGPRRGELSLRGRWLAIIAGTAVLQFSYWLVLQGTATAQEGGAGLIALGMAVVPFVFLVLAFASRHPNAPGATLRAMGWFLVVGVPLGLLSSVLGMAVGLSLGGVVALAPLPDLVTRRQRYLAVLGLLGYLIVLLVVAPGFAVASAAALPFAVHGIVDQTAEERARQGDEHLDAADG